MNDITTPAGLTNTIAIATGVVIYFFDDQCMPCLNLRPKVDRLMKNEFPKMGLILINSREFPDIAAAFGVFASPTILLFFEGKETKRFSKFVSVAELEEAVERHYRMVF
jgi:thioredoxin 1